MKEIVNIFVSFRWARAFPHRIFIFYLYIKQKQKQKQKQKENKKTKNKKQKTKQNNQQKQIHLYMSKSYGSFYFEHQHLLVSNVLDETIIYRRSVVISVQCVSS